MPLPRPTPALAAALALLATPLLAQSDPTDMAEDRFIRLGGTVVEASAETFTLDYGDGLITVDMSDYDDLPEAATLLNGDEVTVYGRIDEDLFQKAEIEASGVYVDSLKTFFDADPADNERFDDWGGPETEISRATLRGRVAAVSPDIGQFELDIGTARITVETHDLMYDPYDDAGYQTVETGDRVSVAGTIDREFVEGRVLEARSVVTLESSAEN